MTRKHRKPSDRLDASQLFPILDELGGIEGLDADPIGEPASDGPPPKPLSEAAIQQARDRIGRIGDAELPRKPDRSRWWRWAAAILPVLMLLGSVPYVFVWSGRYSSKELYFEDAVRIVFEERYQMASREAALGRVAASIRQAITSLKMAVEAQPALLEPARQAVRRLEKEVAGEGIETVVPAGRLGGMQEIITGLRSSDSEALAVSGPRLIEDLVRACTAGMQVLHRARGMGGSLARHAPSHLGHILRRLEGLNY